MRLAPEQVWLFRLLGYVKLPEMLPAETVSALKALIDADIREEREPVVRDADGQVRRLSKVLDRDPLFREVATSPLILDPLEDLIGPNIEIVTNVHNHVTLRRADNGNNFHRDIPTWTRGLVTVLIYLEEASAERGCTQLVPGSHLLPWSTHKMDAFQTLAGGRLADQAVRAESPAGGMLVIDSLLWHSVGVNKTGEPRTTITLGYNAPDTLSTVEDPVLTLVRGERGYLGHRPAPSPGNM